MEYSDVLTQLIIDNWKCIIIISGICLVMGLFNLVHTFKSKKTDIMLLFNTYALTGISCSSVFFNAALIDDINELNNPLVIFTPFILIIFSIIQTWIIAKNNK